MDRAIENFFLLNKVPNTSSKLGELERVDLALFISHILRTAPSSRPILLVLSDARKARDLMDDLRSLSSNRRVYYLPFLDLDYKKNIILDFKKIYEKMTGLFEMASYRHLPCHEEGGPPLFLTTHDALLEAVPHPKFLWEARLLLSINQTIDRDECVDHCLRLGYQKKPTVYDPGTISVRGGVVDIFSPRDKWPRRILWYGDLIESITFFDPQSQMTLSQQTKGENTNVTDYGFILYPIISHGTGRMDSSLREQVVERLKTYLDSSGYPKMDRDSLIEEYKRTEGCDPRFIHLFPILQQKDTPQSDVSIMDYVSDPLLIFEEKNEEQWRATYEKTEKLYQELVSNKHPIAPFSQLYIDPENINKRLSFFAPIVFNTLSSDFFITSVNVDLSRERDEVKKKKGESSYSLLEPFIQRLIQFIELGYDVHLVSHSILHRDQLIVLLERLEKPIRLHKEDGVLFDTVLSKNFDCTEKTLSPMHIHFWVGFLEQSKEYPLLKSVFISEEEIFGKKKKQAMLRHTQWQTNNATDDKEADLSSQSAKFIRKNTFKELLVGDILVHKEHGLGRYLGLRRMKPHEGIETDFVTLEYQGGDKLYVPVTRLNLLQRYSESHNLSKNLLDKLGGESWVKVQKKAKIEVEKIAHELLLLHAARKLAKGPYLIDDHDRGDDEYREFELEFPYDETADQIRAILDVEKDLFKKKLDPMGEPYTPPMDRLICGDVGYGKTEVAMRAAYRVVMRNKQVAVLVPTTLLALQHFETMTQRFKNTGVHVEMVSRLRSPQDIKKIAQQLFDQKIDILIGTQKIFSPQFEFKDLGLIIIDEEHRFGVVHKEQFKKLKKNVHCLTLTATPIPRTLHMSLSGIRDVSLITTPPTDRLSVRTFVSERSLLIIRQAIEFELARHGQVYFVHNRIESLAGVGRELQSLFPKAKVEVIHAQMDPEHLESSMILFYQGKVDLLVSTSVIESGIDVPRANTMIIDKANLFGLAELYQLRGRIGRSNQRAYCYLLVDDEKKITKDARERLRVIHQYSELGSGFSVASHDFDIRGGGDILGYNQSGHVTHLGLDMYLELLEGAIEGLKQTMEDTTASTAMTPSNRKEIMPSKDPEIAMKIEAYIPDTYVLDLPLRMELYQELSQTKTLEDVTLWEKSFSDRFGDLPPEVKNLSGLQSIKILLKPLGVTHMNVGPKKASLQFSHAHPMDIEKMLLWIRKSNGKYEIVQDKLVFSHNGYGGKEGLTELLDPLYRLYDCILGKK